jgi:DNA-binding CsgD family transcriptional regulator
MTIPERHSFEFSYTTRWVHRITNEVLWVVGKAKPFLIDSDGNFAIDLHIVIQLYNHPKVTCYDWNYSYKKEDGSRVYVSKSSPKNIHVKLTKKEKEIAKMILDGKKSKEIGELLNISTSTVGTHRKHILKKLKARNMGEMIKILALYDFG